MPAIHSCNSKNTIVWKRGTNLSSYRRSWSSLDSTWQNAAGKEAICLDHHHICFTAKLFCITVFTRFPHSTYLRQVHYADRQITINMHFKRPQPPSILQQPCRPFTVGGKFTKLAETALPFNEGLGSNVSHSASHTLDLSSSLRPYKSSSCIAQLHISKSFPWDILRHPRHSVSCLLQDHTWWRLAVGVRSLDLLS